MRQEPTVHMVGAMVTAAVLLVALVGCGDYRGNEEESLEIVGYVELRPGEAIIGDGRLYDLGSACDGDSTMANGSANVRRYFSAAASNYRAGAEVVAEVNGGGTAGTGKLDEGEWVALPTDSGTTDHVCKMPFTADIYVTDVHTVRIGAATTTVTTNYRSYNFDSPDREHPPLRLVPDLA